MCGIGGIIRFDAQQPPSSRLRDMLAPLQCRGPDHAAVFAQHHVGFVHTRLRVIDPLHGGQPMTDLASGLTVVFNGEIYNHRELRHQLERLGHRFVSDHADTEVLLHGYHQWGEGLPARLEGMFAFAVYDPAKRTVFLARDRAGKKPLWVRRGDEEWSFASHIASLIAGGGRRPLINPAALRHFLAFGYTGSNSLLRSIDELPAGHWLVIGPSGRAKGKAYWSPPPVGGGESPRPEHLQSVVRGALIDAVERRLEADVPLGCFLSGGIDSSLIAAIAQRALAARMGRLRTFSVAMPDAAYDEGPFARRVAEHLGAEHHELVADADVERDLVRLIQTTGEPLGDASLLPTYWLSRAARRHVTVALSGDGGDELFGGYERYRAMSIIARRRALLRLVPTFGMSGPEKSSAARLARLLRAARSASPSEQYRSIVQIFSPAQLQRLGLRPGDAPPPLALPDLEDPADAARRWDFGHYLPFDLLRKVDRASMAVALEVRCPMLDTRLVELAMSTPMSVLTERGERGEGTLKALLRRIAAEFLPPDIVRRPKMGFAVPIGGWFAGPLRQMLERWLLDEPALTGIGFDRLALESMIVEHAERHEDHAHRLFTLLSLAVWLRWVNNQNGGSAWREADLASRGARRP